MKFVEPEEIMLFLQKSIAEETKMDLGEIDVDRSMGAFGLDSINSVFILHHLENWLQTELSTLLFWDYPTIRSLSNYLYQMMLQEHA